MRFNSQLKNLSFQVDPSTGLIDYDALAASASLFKPRVIIAGVSCYSRHLDYARFRQIADANGDRQTLLSWNFPPNWISFPALPQAPC